MTRVYTTSRATQSRHSVAQVQRPIIPQVAR
jgi:hypothetical protein